MAMASHNASQWQRIQSNIGGRDDGDDATSGDVWARHPAIVSPDGEEGVSVLFPGNEIVIVPRSAASPRRFTEVYARPAPVRHCRRRCRGHRRCRRRCRRHRRHRRCRRRCRRRRYAYGPYQLLGELERRRRPLLRPAGCGGSRGRRPRPAVPRRPARRGCLRGRAARAWTPTWSLEPPATPGAHRAAQPHAQAHTGAAARGSRGLAALCDDSTAAARAAHLSRAQPVCASPRQPHGALPAPGARQLARLRPAAAARAPQRVGAVRAHRLLAPRVRVVGAASAALGARAWRAVDPRRRRRRRRQ